MDTVLKCLWLFRVKVSDVLKTALDDLLTLFVLLCVVFMLQWLIWHLSLKGMLILHE